LKKPWKDGTTALLLEPFDLLARISALIPPPRLHMVRYHGVLSSHAKVRREIVPPPEPRSSPDRVVQLELFRNVDGANVEQRDNAPDCEPRRRPWAWLLRHVFQIDVSVCTACGGPMRWLEAATAPTRSLACSQSIKKAISGINDFVEPAYGYTNYELAMIRDNSDYFAKTTFWKDGQAMPPGCNPFI